METFFIFKIVIVAMAVACGVHDARHLTIPNKYILIMLGLFPVALILNYSAMPLDGHLLGGAVIFVISYGLFALKLMGGGDAKMASVIGLWLGLKALIPFVIMMALTGGILASISLILKKNKNLIPATVSPESWFGQLKEDKSVVPYGIAIAMGAVFGIF